MVVMVGGRFLMSEVLLWCETHARRREENRGVFLNEVCQTHFHDTLGVLFAAQGFVLRLVGVSNTPSSVSDTSSVSLRSRLRD